MASWMVHLRVADRLLDQIDNLEETEFIVGNIAPDSGVPNEDWSVYVPNKTQSHYMDVKLKKEGKSSICPDKFLTQYFTPEMRRDYSRKKYSFYLGYYVHLLTDILWAEEIVAELIAADRKAYEADRAVVGWKWKEDWYDLDFLYLREHPDFRAFRIYEQAEGFQNEYMDIFSGDAFDNRRKYIVGFYRQKRDGLDREYPYLTKERMDRFTESAVEQIREKLSPIVDGVPGYNADTYQCHC